MTTAIDAQRANAIRARGRRRAAGARSGEVRGVTRGEVDFDAAVWKRRQLMERWATFCGVSASVKALRSMDFPMAKRA